MENEPIESVFIDPNLSAYEKFFDMKWAEEIIKGVEKSCLKAAVGTLMVSWRSTNGAHLMPWLIVNMVKEYANGENKGFSRSRDSHISEVVEKLSEELEQKMHYNLDREGRAALRRSVTKIEGKARKVSRAAQSMKFPLQAYWNDLIEKSEFRFCILGIQRTNYGSLVFGYEDFLANVIRTKDPGYDSLKCPIKDEFAKHFGDVLRDYCWCDFEIKLVKGRSKPASEGRIKTSHFEE
jgi:hypothetical protein